MTSTRRNETKSRRHSYFSHAPIRSAPPPPHPGRCPPPLPCAGTSPLLKSFWRWIFPPVHDSQVGVSMDLIITFYFRRKLHAHPPSPVDEPCWHTCENFLCASYRSGTLASKSWAEIMIRYAAIIQSNMPGKPSSRPSTWQMLAYSFCDGNINSTIVSV